MGVLRVLRKSGRASLFAGFVGERGGGLNIWLVDMPIWCPERHAGMPQVFLHLSRSSSTLDGPGCELKKHICECDGVHCRLSCSPLGKDEILLAGPRVLDRKTVESCPDVIVAELFELPGIRFADVHQQAA